GLRRWGDAVDRLGGSDGRLGGRPRPWRRSPDRDPQRVRPPLTPHADGRRVSLASYDATLSRGRPVGWTSRRGVRVSDARFWAGRTPRFGRTGTVVGSLASKIGGGR